MSDKPSTPAHPNNRTGEVKMDVAVLLGSTRLPLDTLLNCSEGSLIQLDNLGNAPDVEVDGLSFSERTREPGHGLFPLVDVQVNGKSFARGEVVTVAENFGVRLVKILNR